jgi:acyl-CoA synthetase (NDP forming)
MSHTGALAGADSVYTAAFKQAGVIRVEDDDELNDVVFALLNCPLPKGNRIGILSIGGGPGALTAEACEKDGMSIGKIDPATIAKLDECLPARWSGRNPVDMAGISAAEYPSIAASLWALMDDDNIDIILLQAPIILDRNQLVNRMSLNEQQIKAYRQKEAKNLMMIRDKVAESGKPVILMWQFSAIAADPEISVIFSKAKIPVYGNARRAARVLKHLVWYRSYLDGIKG